MRQLELVQKTFFSYIVQNWPWPESFHCIEVMLAAPLRSRAVLGPISGKDDQWKRCGPRFEDLDCMERAVREAWREVKSNMFAHFASETTEVNLDCQMNPNLWRGKSVSKEDSHSCQITVNIDIILIRNQYLWWLSKLDSTCEIVICISRDPTFLEMIWWLLETWSNCRSWFHCAVIQHMSLSHDHFCSVVQHTNIRIYIYYIYNYDLSLKQVSSGIWDLAKLWFISWPSDRANSCSAQRSQPWCDGARTYDGHWVLWRLADLPLRALGKVQCWSLWPTSWITTWPLPYVKFDSASTVFLVSSFIRLFVFDLIPWLLEHVSHKSLEAEVASVRTATLAEDVQLSQSLLKLAAFFEFAEGPLPRSEVFFFQSRAHLILQGCSTIRGYQGCNAWWCLGLGSSVTSAVKHSWSMSEISIAT